MSTNNTQQATWVAIGSFFSFIVGIVSPMILSRYFTKADYGTYKQVMYVYNTLLVVFTLGLPRAYSYFLPKRPIKQTKSIIKKITAIFVILGAIFSVFLFVFAKPIASFLHNEDLEIALKIFSPVPFFLLPTMGLEGIYASLKKTKYLAIYTVCTRIFTIMCVVLPTLFFSGNYIYAIIGFDIASLLTCGVALLMMYLPVKDIPSENTDITYKDIFDFAIPLMTASIWGMVFNSANQFFISRYFGNEVFADFSNGFMEIPFASMVFSAVATVMLPAIARIDSGEGMSDQVLSIWNNSINKSAKVIFPMLFFCIFFPTTIITCMYGELYTKSGVYFLIRNIGGLFTIVPFAPIMLAIGKTKEFSRSQMIAALAIVSLEYVSVKVIDSPIAIAAISEICRLLLVILMLKVIADYASMSISQLISIKQMLHIALPSIVSGIICSSVLQCFSLNKWLLLGFAGLTYLIIYYISCYIFKVSYRDIVLNIAPSLLSKYKMIKFIP